MGDQSTSEGSMAWPRLLAGVPSVHKSLFRRLGVAAHDPAAYLEFAPDDRVVIVRDVERARARSSARADEVRVYEDFEPSDGLSGDREVRAAQAIAECLARRGASSVVADRALPLLIAEAIRGRGIEVRLDHAWGVADRRCKTPDERSALRAAQRLTEDAVRLACEMIAGANVDDAGGLVDAAGGGALTSERVKAAVISFLAERGAVTDDLIVAGGPAGSDCHFTGAGALRSGEPVIVDIFPCHVASGFHGDCSRTVVHGTASDAMVSMHAAVVEAKRASIGVVRAGVTGEDVHRAAVAVIAERGFHVGWPPKGSGASLAAMTHGTGHGIGLDLKEPPLLDFKGPTLLEGDCVTVEPGLYRPDTGGVRIEDMLLVTGEGSENLNVLHEGLDWRV
ncbi:MAG: Xaa-Pro peptidase family protein [Planctomycetota bacterium]